MQVWKFQLEDSGWTFLALPMGADILSVGAQRSALMLWAAVDPEHLCEVRCFWTALTGADLPLNLGRFFGTVQRDWFVVHVWELILGEKANG